MENTKRRRPNLEVSVRAILVDYYNNKTNADKAFIKMLLLINDLPDDERLIWYDVIMRNVEAFARGETHVLDPQSSGSIAEAFSPPPEEEWPNPLVIELLSIYQESGIPGLLRWGEKTQNSGMALSDRASEEIDIMEEDMPIFSESLQALVEAAENLKNFFERYESNPFI